MSSQPSGGRQSTDQVYCRISLPRYRSANATSILGEYTIETKDGDSLSLRSHWGTWWWHLDGNPLYTRRSVAQRRADIHGTQYHHENSSRRATCCADNCIMLIIFCGSGRTQPNASSVIGQSGSCKLAQLIVLFLQKPVLANQRGAVCRPHQYCIGSPTM